MCTFIVNHEYETIAGSLIYCGKYEMDKACHICGRRTEKANEFKHEFIKGDSDNPDEIYNVGESCVRKFVLVKL